MTKGDKLKVRAKDGGDFPATFSGEGKCRDCGDAMGWIETSTGKKMPVELEPDSDGVHEVHWARCSKEGGDPKPSPAPKPKSDSSDLAGRVTRLEEAVFGKVKAVLADIPPVNDLPFAILLAALLIF
jgi:hypothetical protein